MKFDVPRIGRDLAAVEPADELYVGTCTHCDTKWQGESIAHCPTCHMTFRSVSGFDKHRFHGACRTPDEMRERGYEPNEDGHWRQPRPEDTLPVNP